METKNNKVALIAGSENEIGAAAAKKMKASGWKVVGIDSLPETKLGKDLDGYFFLDMTDRGSLEELAAEVEKGYGEIHALFCATGFEEDRQCGDFLKTPVEQWQKCLNGWLGSSVNACAAVAPYMVTRKEGKIMILSPDYSKGKEENILTAAGAGTLHGFAKSFGVEMAKENVLVNCIYPNVPFDVEAVAATVQFLAESGNYVSAQVLSVKGQE